jgi:hypothetical protein
MDNYEVLFVTNDSNHSQEFTLSFPLLNKIEKWDPNTGEIKIVNTPANIRLGAFDGILFKINSN